MSTSFSLSGALRRSIAVAVVAGSAVAVAGAQTKSQTESQTESQIESRTGAQTGAPAVAQGASAVLAQPVSTGFAPSVADGSDALFSSSVSPEDATDAGSSAMTANLASLEKSFAVPEMSPQYGRRRYGAPRYRGSNTNADGSEKYTVYAGVGFGIPVGTNTNYLTTSYGFEVGGGRNFNKHFGVNLEFAYDHFGLNGQTIDNQSVFYFDDPTNANGLDANNHIWNLSVQPVYQIYSGEGLGAYITGGAGFYHKVTNFTLPEEVEDCEGFYGCGVFDVNENVDHYTSNAPGFDGGIGLTYKFSRFANERLFAEVRYVYMDNSFRPGITAANYTTYTGNNYFPQNSQTTSYIPVKFGIRF